MSMKRLMIAAGGTGGHVFPAMAVATYLGDTFEIAWVGNDNSFEAKQVRHHSWKWLPIQVRATRQGGYFQRLRSWLQAFRAIQQSIRHIRMYQPDLILGMGGYVAGPVGVAAWWCNVPLLIHEQNARSGLTNRWLAWYASHIYCAFPNVFPRWSHKVSVIGNPIRADLKEIKAPKLQANALRVLILGGSRGARVLNETMPTILAGCQAPERWNIWHQTGVENQSAVQARYEALGLQARVFAFIDDMKEAYERSDLVIARAGAMTVSEIAQVGRAALFIPLPTAADDHQTYNTQQLVQAGAAHCIPERDKMAAQCQQYLNDFLKHPEQLMSMGSRAQGCAYNDATEQLAKACWIYAKNT